MRALALTALCWALPAGAATGRVERIAPESVSTPLLRPAASAATIRTLAHPPLASVAAAQGARAPLVAPPSSVAAAEAARRARAAALVTAGGNLWTAEDLRKDAESFAAGRKRLSLAPWLADSLEKRAQLYESAAKTQRQSWSPLRQAAARLVLAPEAARLRTRARRLREGAPPAPELLGQNAPQARRLALSRGLERYVPGFDAAQLVTGALFQDAAPELKPLGGYVPGENLDELRPTWVRPSGDDASFLYVAAHEAFHQRDHGYVPAYRAMSRLLGPERGNSLLHALVEGYTELRGREAMERALDDAVAGQDGVPLALARSLSGNPLRGRFGPEDRAELGRRLERLVGEDHDYESYVELARALIERPGGRTALDALVDRGDVAPLYAVVGRERLGELGRRAAAAETLGAGSTDAMALASATGLQVWLEKGLALAVREPLDAAELERARRREHGLQRLVKRLGALVAEAPDFTQARAIGRVAGHGLARRLDAGEDPNVLVAEVERDLRSPWTRLLLRLPIGWQRPAFQSAALGALGLAPLGPLVHALRAFTHAPKLQAALSWAAAVQQATPADRLHAAALIAGLGLAASLGLLLVKLDLALPGLLVDRRTRRRD